MSAAWLYKGVVTSVNLDQEHTFNAKGQEHTFQGTCNKLTMNNRTHNKTTKKQRQTLRSNKAANLGASDAFEKCPRGFLVTHRAFGRILVCTFADEAERTFGCGRSRVQIAMLRFISTHTDTRRSGAGIGEPWCAVQKCVHISWCSVEIAITQCVNA